MKQALFFSAILIAMINLVGCNTAPKTEAKKESLGIDVKATVDQMNIDDPTLKDFLAKSYGHVVFPSVGKGGLIVGGAYGRGEVYEQGKLIGYADITQATIGLQAGGQTFAEVIAFENKAALDRFINNKYEVAANASAVALKSGAAASAKYTDGVAIFTYVKGGLMAEASVGGQRFNYSPLR